MDNKKQQLFTSEISENNHEQQAKKEETTLQEKIRQARESRTALIQIDKLEKEIVSMEKKILIKKGRLVELGNKL